MRCDTMRAMRRSVPKALVPVAVFAAALIRIPAAAFGLTVGQLPPSPFADIGEVALIEGKKPGFALEVR